VGPFPFEFALLKQVRDGRDRSDHQRGVSEEREDLK